MTFIILYWRGIKDIFCKWIVFDIGTFFLFIHTAFSILVQPGELWWNTKPCDLGLNWNNNMGQITEVQTYDIEHII